MLCVRVGIHVCVMCVLGVCKGGHSCVLGWAWVCVLGWAFMYVC